jgi:hypothetical protein
MSLLPFLPYLSDKGVITEQISELQIPGFHFWQMYKQMYCSRGKSVRSESFRSKS